MSTSSIQGHVKHVSGHRALRAPLGEGSGTQSSVRLKPRWVERLFLGVYKKDGHAGVRVSSVHWSYPRLPDTLTSS